MARKHIKFWINDLSIWDYIHTKNNITEFIINLVKNDMQGTTGNLKQDKLVKEIRRLDLDNNLKQLLIWKELKHLMPLEEAQKIMSGEKTLEETHNQLLKMAKTDNTICDLCNHEHYGEEKKFTCKNIICICGVRG